METTTAGVTVRRAEFEVILEKLAMMFEVPTEIPEASPYNPELFPMVAIPVFDEFQLAQVVRLCTVLSTRVAEAINCCVVPFGILGAEGVTAIDATADEVRFVEPVTPP